MASIFSKIINGDLPAYKVAESDRQLAFLDINPIAKGHCLVIPKLEIDYIYDLPDQELADLHLFAKKVALAIEKVVACERIGVMVAGLEVPHAHIHLVPMNNIHDLSFTRPKLDCSQEEFEQLAEAIQKEFQAS